MSYFKVLGVVLGLWMILGGALGVFFMKNLKSLVSKVYPEVRPRWVPIAGTLFLALVLWTWVEFVKSVSMENFVVTLVMSLGLAKSVPMIFFYKKFREFLLALVAEPLAFRVVALSSASVGLALLAMGLFF
jgi:hypothetical protein